MTFDPDFEAGQRLVRYNELLKNLASLRSSISDAGRQLRDLGNALAVNVGDRSVRVTDRKMALHTTEQGRSGWNQIDLDLSELAARVVLLHELMAEKERMDQCLRETGFGESVRPG